MKQKHCHIVHIRPSRHNVLILLVAKDSYFALRNPRIVQILGMRGTYICTCVNPYIGESKSLPLTPDTGVPRDSVLGPTLFFTLLNDVPSACFDCTAILFADDTTICAIGKNVNGIAFQLSILLLPDAKIGCLISG